MQELDDIVLLRLYTEQNSEAAFATLVSRHVNHVYSVALRLTRNPHSAEEITQAVFVILAKKSRNLSKHVVLSGWLYETSRLTAITFIRGEIRRACREQEAHMQTVLNESEPDVWPQIAPLLDAAMARLSEPDRRAVVLRFFDGKSMKEVGAALGATEAATKMRLGRAVEKLRGFFTKRGLVVPAAILTAAISANSIQAAPVGLATTATAVAVGKTTVAASTSVLVKSALKLMAWAKLKTAAAIGAVMLLAGGAITVAVSSGSNASPPTTAVILQQVQQKYASLSSYSETVNTFLETQTDFKPPRGPRVTGAKSTDSTDIKLGRPNSYRLDNSVPDRYAMWSVRNGDFWMMMNGDFYHHHDARTADDLLYVVGAGIVPTAFFGRNERSRLAALAASNDLSRQPDEEISGDNCYVLSGSTRITDEPDALLTLWIDKEDLLIRQLKAVMVIKAKIPYTNTVIQTHERIRLNPNLSPEDFVYPIPPGVVPKEKLPFGPS